MKKAHPDEDKIPTLRDLVFPGNQEFRRAPEPERERIEPRLEDDEDKHLDTPVLEREDAADPFILLPEDELDWKADHPPESNRTQPEDDSTPLPDTLAVAAGNAGQETSAALPGEETGSAENEPDTSATDDTDGGIEVEEEVSIEDLMTYFHHPRAPTSVDLAPPQAPLTDEEASADAAEQPVAESPVADSTPPAQEAEAIRAAVRSVLEQELDRLTDVVTDAVIARLRD
ncbi:hypothetical protein [Acidihalobacter prosperus]